MAQQAPLPCGKNTSPLALTPPLHDLPRGLRKNFPKFHGDGKQHIDGHISAFIIVCGVLGVEYEDVSVLLFV